MTDEAHIYKMAYTQLEGALCDLLDQCFDAHGKPRIPPAAAIIKARGCLPEERRPKAYVEHLSEPV